MSAEERQRANRKSTRAKEKTEVQNLGRQYGHLGHMCVSGSTESTSTCPHELLQQGTLTLVPVVVSALVSAPRRSNTDVLWRPGREVTS